MTHDAQQQYIITGKQMSRIYNSTNLQEAAAVMDEIRDSTPPHTPAPDNKQLIKDTKLRIRHLFLDDSKCELCEKVTEEDGYDGQNEGCEKGLCIECAIHKALVEFSDAIARTATLAENKHVYWQESSSCQCSNKEVTWICWMNLFK